MVMSSFIYLASKTNWVENKQHAWYCCPECGMKYQPWKMGSDLHQPNKILVAQAHEDIAQWGVKKGEVMTWYVLWADTPAKVMQEIRARFFGTSSVQVQ